MSKKDEPLYVERRKDGEYAVERAHSERASAVFPTQKQAKEWAKGHTEGPVHVERVRNTKNGSPDKWRKA